MLTIVVANITPDEAAKHYRAAGLSGTATASVGFGAWGTEPGTRVEFGNEREEQAARDATVALLRERGEECAFCWRVRDGSPYGRGMSAATFLLYASGGSATLRSDDAR